MKNFINIKNLYGILDPDIKRRSGIEMNAVETIANAYLKIENGRIIEFGEMTNWVENAAPTIDLKGKSVLPCYADSHTHIVFAEPREHEFELKIQGKTYEEIAAAGGGILNSAAKLGEKSEEKLLESATQRVQQVMRLGTGALEIKSGYGLTIDAELKMLRVIQKLYENFPIPIKASFLGAHAIPSIYKSNPKEYIEKVIYPCIEKVAKEELAEYIDIFIEKNYFSLEDANRILDYSDKFGLKPKLHVNQLSNMGALQLAVDRGALSADHLEEMTQTEIDYLKDKSTIGTILPSCSFFIKIPYAPARQMIDSGLPIALASDYNPGSTPSGNMNFVLSLACIYQKLLPAEAFNAATINGAYAMDCSKELGSISIGKRANFFTSSELTSLASIPYSFGRSLIDEVYINGERFS
jgi:imidazolonepropionase